MTTDYARLRKQMVDLYIRQRGILDERLLASMQEVPRHIFTPFNLQAYAYEDTPLPIGDGQTISQPYIVALMANLACIQPDATVLEIGTGSGYAAAVLSRLAKKVYTIERIDKLAQTAQMRFQELDYTNIETKVGDGTIGWFEKGPFDAILVSAGAPVAPQSLQNQLKIGGRLVIPVGDSSTQELHSYLKLTEKNIVTEVFEYVRFVPLIGEEGWRE